MSLVTAVMVGNAESECEKLGSAAMDDVGFRDEDEEDEVVMSENREALEVEGVREYWLLVGMGVNPRG
jgi:hypothetical protein